MNDFDALFSIYSKNRRNFNYTINTPAYIEEDINNNISFVHPKSMSNPTSPKHPQPNIDAQLIGDDFFRMLVARDSTGQMFNRSKYFHSYVHSHL